MIEVGKIMTKKVHTISPDSTLKECAQILKKTRVNGLVVQEGAILNPDRLRWIVDLSQESDRAPGFLRSIAIEIDAAGLG